MFGYRRYEQREAEAPWWLECVGAVGTGWSLSEGRRLLERLRPLARASSPFSTPTPGEYRSRARWVRPELVCLIEYRAWTPGGYLRHPAFKELLEDRDPGNLAEP